MSRLLLALGVGLLLASLASSSLANGAPVRIPLSKLPGVVNFGTEPAVGIAEVIAVEGDVVVTTQGLPRLTNELYQAWLVNTQTGERLSVAKYNVTADGTSKTQVIVTIGNREFNLFAITVEPEPDPSPNDDSRIVLAGYWPGREPGAAATAAAATARALGVLLPTPTIAVTPGATVVSVAPPTGLPRTGTPAFGTLAALLAALGAGALLLAREARR